MWVVREERLLCGVIVSTTPACGAWTSVFLSLCYIHRPKLIFKFTYLKIPHSNITLKHYHCFASIRHPLMVYRFNVLEFLLSWTPNTSGLWPSPAQFIVQILFAVLFTKPPNDGATGETRTSHNPQAFMLSVPAARKQAIDARLSDQAYSVNRAAVVVVFLMDAKWRHSRKKSDGS